MKIILLAATVIAVCGEVIVVRKSDHDALWEEFKKFYHKHYSAGEDIAKKAVFFKTLEFYLEHNRAFYNRSHTFTVGLNQFTDMLEAEYRTSGLDTRLDCNNRSMVYVPPKNVSIPDSVNWYEKGYVHDPEDQGICGACWAFCGIAALEGQYKRLTGELVKLSEQQLIDCSTVTGNRQCKGGQMCRAYEYAVLAGGVNSHSDYPFRNETGECKFSKDSIAVNVTGYIEIPYGDEHALLMAVALIGPVAAGVDGSRKRFRSYKSGIYDDPLCNNVTLSHAVTIVGYGTEEGKDYWLVKNSWGKDWGQNGFGKMVRNKNNQCGLASNALFPTLGQDKNGTPLLTGHRAHR